MKKLIITLLVLLLLAACTNNQQGKNLENVKVRLKWMNQAQFAGMYVAKEKGFYQEQGLNVSLEEGGVNHPPISDVVSGNADFGVAGADDLIVAVSEGKQIKAVAVIYKISPVVYFSLKSSNITKPEDFIGKTVGVKHGTGTDYPYVTMLKNLGINRSLINEVNVSYDLTPLYEGKIDVWPGFRINEPQLAKESGYNVDEIYPEEWGVDMYADVIITNDKTIQNNPELVRKFVQATLQGWQYATENEDEALNITMEFVDAGSREHQLYMLEKSIPLIHTGTSKLGEMDYRKWDDMTKQLKDLGIINDTVNTTEVYTNEFVG